MTGEMVVMYPNGTETKEVNFSFSKEMSKPNLEEGLMLREDALHVVLNRICYKTGGDKRKKLVEAALVEFKESVMELFEESSYNSSKAGVPESDDEEYGDEDGDDDEENPDSDDDSGDEDY